MSSETPDFRDLLYTVDAQGRRKWVYAHLFSGAWRRRRGILALLLIAIYLAAPFAHVGLGRLIHIDIPNRHFTLFGTLFWPQDFFILVLLVLIGLVATLLTVSLVGRFFCGWLCPHNVFLEFVFRPIEQFWEGPALRRRKQDRGPMNGTLLLRKTGKWLTYLALAWGLANTAVGIFLPSTAHWHDFIGLILVDPSKHPTAFTFWAAMAGVILFNFGWFREQTCTIVCPYGRLQSVMLDSDSLTIAYDSARGEPRDRKGTDGDCIDCGFCQVVCPTGIDIRNGNQLECIHCAACVDACDVVMLKNGKAPGLIRYASENALAGKKPFRPLRPRTLWYSAVLLVLASVTVTFISLRSPLQVTALRDSAVTSRDTTEDGHHVLRRPIKLALLNKTAQAQRIEIRLPEAFPGRLAGLEGPFTLEGATRREEQLIVLVDAAQAQGQRGSVIETHLAVSADGIVRQEIPVRLIHP